MTAVTAVAVAAAGMALTVMMFPMVIALDIGIKYQITGDQRLHCRIRIAGNAAIQLDTSSSQSHLGTASDTAADQHVRMEGCQNTSQRTVAAAIGIYNLRSDDLAVLYVIDLKPPGMSKMLEDISVFICNRNSHYGISFRFFILSGIMLLKAQTLPTVLCTVAEAVISTRDLKRFSLYKHICQFLSGGSVDQLHSGTGNSHPFTAGLLGKPLPVNKPDGLIFIH